MKSLESQLQAECVKWFKYQFPRYVIFAIPNGGLRNIKTASRLKKEGALAGVPDLCVIGEGTIIFIEMKYGKGVVTPAQRETMDRIDDNQVPCYVARSFDEFKRIILSNYHTF